MFTGKGSGHALSKSLRRTLYFMRIYRKILVLKISTLLQKYATSYNLF